MKDTAPAKSSHERAQIGEGIGMNESFEAPVIRVRDWDRLYENNRSREMKRTNWFPAPNDLSADGYVELVSHEQGGARIGLSAVDSSKRMNSITAVVGLISSSDTPREWQRRQISQGCDLSAIPLWIALCSPCTTGSKIDLTWKFLMLLMTRNKDLRKRIRHNRFLAGPGHKGSTVLLRKRKEAMVFNPRNPFNRLGDTDK